MDDSINEFDYVTSNYDLVDLMKKRNKDLKMFKDSRRKFGLNPPYNIYHENKLPKKIRKNEMGIIYLENKESQIGHWVGYYNKSNLDYVYYIDSLVGEVSSNVRKFLDTAGKSNIIGYKNPVQIIDSMKCGLFVVDILSDINNLLRKTDYMIFRVFAQYKPISKISSVHDDIVDYNEDKVIIDNVLADSE